MGVPCNLTGTWLFLCEQHPWPMVHFLMAGKTYWYTRNYWVTMWLLLFWEFIEVLISAISHSLALFANSATPDGSVTAADMETIFDSILGDLFIMGNLGILVMILLVKATDAPRVIHPSKSEWRIYVKYLIQLALYAAPTPGIQVYIGDTFVSIGWLVMLIWWPILEFLVNKWNEFDPVYKGEEYSMITGKPLPSPTTFEQTKNSWKIVTAHPLAYQPEGSYAGRGFNYVVTSWNKLTSQHLRTTSVFSLFDFIFIASLVYPYFDSYFIEVLIHIGATVVILSVVLIWFTPKPKHPRSDSHMFNF